MLEEEKTPRRDERGASSPRFTPTPSPDDPVRRDRHAPPHRRARGEADRGARDLDLAAALHDLALRRAQPLPARPDRGRAREDEPGARDARHLPPAARAGADAADGARV